MQLLSSDLATIISTISIILVLVSLILSTPIAAYSQFSFIVPNVLNDGHDGSLATADQWLQTNLGPLLSSSDFQNNGLLVLTFDEGNLTDLSNGGGHVATIVIGPQVKSGYQSSTLYQHESTLRLILATLGIFAFPGNAANAPSMGEFFK